MDILVIRAKRKTMSLSVNDDLQAVVRAPFAVPEKDIREFVESNSAWLEKAVLRKQKQLERYDISDDEKEQLKSLAKQVIPERVEYYSRLMNLYPTDVKITSAKKRFGSCNGKNSLCFSYFLMKYPIEAVDYVVVHELAHIKHHNHGKDFYKLIKKYLPDYKERERLLK